MAKCLALFLAALTINLIACDATWAQSPARRCAASKFRFAGKATYGIAKCDAKGLARGLRGGDASVSACVSKVEARFASDWSRAEARGGCAVTGDMTDVAEDLDDHRDDLTSSIGNDSPACQTSGTCTGRSKCSATKMRAAGKKARCRLRCAAKAARKAVAFTEASVVTCFQKCSDRFARAFVRHENADECILPGADTDTLEKVVDDFIDRLTGQMPVAPTTTTTLPASCDGAGRIAIPVDLPEQTNCRAGDPKTKTECKNWEPIGKQFMGNELALQNEEGATAQLYQWEPSPNPKKTVCWYLYREPEGAAPTTETVNGLLCFNRVTCDVCAFDSKTAFCSGDPATACDLTQEDECADAGKGTCLRNPMTVAQLVRPGPGGDNCSECHAAGPIAPKHAYWEAVNAKTKAVNLQCAKKGGPNWIGAPAAWAAQDVAHKVSAPSECGWCHEKGFVNPCPGGGCQFCDAILMATFTKDDDNEDESGAMAEEAPFTDEDACKKFRDDMNCAELPCPGSSTTSTTTTTVP